MLSSMFGRGSKSSRIPAILDGLTNAPNRADGMNAMSALNAELTETRSDRQVTLLSNAPAMKC